MFCSQNIRLHPRNYSHLATIVTEADAEAAGQLLLSSLTNGFAVALVGLNDIGVEGICIHL